MICKTTNLSLWFLETDPDQIITAAVTPARVSVRSVLIRGTMESRVGPSSSPVAKSPAGATGTDLALALPLPPTETESHVTGTRYVLKINMGQ